MGMDQNDTKSAEQQAKIKDLWGLYKEEFGLEGDLYFNLKKSGMSDDQINKILESRNNKVGENLQSWYDLGERKL